MQNLNSLEREASCCFDIMLIVAKTNEISGKLSCGIFTKPKLQITMKGTTFCNTGFFNFSSVLAETNDVK